MLNSCLCLLSICFLVVFNSGLSYLQDPGDLSPENPDGSSGSWYTVCVNQSCQGLRYSGNHPLGCDRYWSYWNMDWVCTTGPCTYCRGGFQMFNCRATQELQASNCVNNLQNIQMCGDKYRPPCLKVGAFCDCLGWSQGQVAPPGYPAPTGESCEIPTCQ